MAEKDVDRISAKGLVVVVMAWNGFQLPWESVFHEQMRGE